ncbi:MAG: hypothetical protein F9Y92_07120 [Thermoplasmatales archaeon]|nr:hypothetical protein [Thermoplasmatales archaeon]
MINHQKSWANSYIAYRDKKKTMEIILKTIKDNEPIRFKELLEKSDSSNRWLSIKLKEMQEKGLIKKITTDVILEDGKVKKDAQAYVLTKKGNVEYEHLSYLFYELYRMIEKSSYFHREGNFGISYDIVQSNDIQLHNIDVNNPLHILYPQEHLIKYLFKLIRNDQKYKFEQTKEHSENYDYILALGFNISKINCWIKDVNETLNKLMEIDIFEDDLPNQIKTKPNKIKDSANPDHIFVWQYQNIKDVKNPKEKRSLIWELLKELERSFKDIITDDEYSHLIVHISDNIKKHQKEIISDLNKEALKHIKEDIKNKKNPLLDYSIRIPKFTIEYTDKNIYKEFFSKLFLNIDTEYLKRYGSYQEVPINDYLLSIKILNLTDKMIIENMLEVEKKMKPDIEDFFNRKISEYVSEVIK